MSKFNASVSTLGIQEVKVQQAIMKLLENSVFNRETAIGNRNALEEQIRRISQKLSTIDFDIDETTAQEIADKISTDLSQAVSRSEAGAATATTKATEAAASATSAASDAADVAEALADMESTIEEHAATAAQTAIAQVTQNVSTAVATAQSAATSATTAATNATTAANNASTKATEATQAATDATAAVAAMKNVNLCVNTVYNASYAQYRKIATFPAVSSLANAVITIYGSMGGWYNAVQKPVYFSLGQRQGGTSYETLDVKAFVFGSSLPQMADIVLYKESNNTFSLYLKGLAAQYFKHNLAMMYNEQVTLALGNFTTSTPTGTLVWSMLSNYKVLSTTDHNHDSAYAALGHNHDAAYAALNHNHSGVYQPVGNYAAANHNHDGTYQPAGSYAAADHNHDTAYAALDHNHDTSYMSASAENVSWLNYRADLAGNAFYVSDIVNDSTATYNLKVTFINRANYKRSCLVNGTTVTLAKGVGKTASYQTTVSGNGSFTIDNIATTVDVFVRIWR